MELITALFLNVASGLIVESGRSAFQKFAESQRQIVKNAIRDTDKRFKRWGVRRALEQWCKSPGFERLYWRMKRGDVQEIDDKDIVESFVQEGGFHTGSKYHSMQRANKVLNLFFSLVVNGLYDARQGHSRMMRRLEHLHQTTHLSLEEIGRRLDSHESEEILHPEGQAMLPKPLDSGSNSGAHPFLDREQDTIHKIEILLQQLKAKGTKGDEEAKEAKAPAQPVFLAGPKRRTLGVLAVLSLPITQKVAAKLFPIRKGHLPYLLRQGHLKKNDDGRLFVPSNIKRRLLADEVEKRTFHEALVDILEPIKEHTDTAVFLCLQYLALDRFDEALLTLADVADGLEAGHTNRWYSDILRNFAIEGFLRKLQPESRARFYNAYGLCLSREGDYKTALKCFAKLRTYSRRKGIVWGIGQSFINAGVVQYKNGEEVAAERLYKKAVVHARTHEDQSLLGKALHNLAMTIADRSPQEAMETFNESLEIKKALGDEADIATGYLGCGSMAIVQGNIAEAARWFKKAEQKAQALDLREIRVFALNNLGSTHLERGLPEKAITLYREARVIAEKEGFDYPLQLSVQGEAMVLLKLEEFGKADSLFRELSILRKQAGDMEGAVIALHDAGFAQIKQGDAAGSRQMLGRSLALARQIGSAEWIYKCRLANALSREEDEGVEQVARVLARLARTEVKKGYPLVAARLMRDRALYLWQNGQTGADIEDAFRSCVALLQQSGSDTGIELINAHKEWLGWLAESGRYEDALEILSEIEKLADAVQDKDLRRRTIDQRGVYLQRLRKFDEAEPLHRHALALARRRGDVHSQAVSLTNLAELLRKTGRPGEALPLYKQAEALIEELDDIDDLLLTAANRALALRQLERYEEAETVLLYVRDASRKAKKWIDYVRALHDLGDLAWLRGDLRGAIRRYSRAIEVADEHNVEQGGLLATIAYGNAVLGRKASSTTFQRLRVLADTDVARSLGPHETSVLFRVLAELSEDNNEDKAAIAYWREGAMAAEEGGDRDDAALCWGALGEFYLEHDELEQADEAFQRALRWEDDPEGQAALLYDRLRALLHIEREEDAEIVLEQALTFAEEHGFALRRIDLYMLVGDYNWTDGEYLEALKMYIMAMLSGFNVEPPDGRSLPYAEIGTHVFDRLLGLLEKGQSEQVHLLQTALKAWLHEKLDKNVEQSIRYFLWPLRAALRLATEYPSVEKIPDDEANAILEDEILQTFELDETIGEP